ncbi:MAG: hypothetical protein LRY68_08150 [Sulfurospirillum sp.]|nr:hypothetical protein [Sulfurospirillum sp.]
MLEELRSIKEHLASQASSAQPKKASPEFMNFVKQFRLLMMANTFENIYPEVIYEGRYVGVDYQGYLYDKKTQMRLNMNDASALYKMMYAEHQRTGNHAKEKIHYTIKKLSA